MAPAVLPRRDAGDRTAREHLDNLARHARPLVLARDRAVSLNASGWADLVPDRAVVRGTVVRVAGGPGTGATSAAFELAAAFTAMGEWAAAVDLDGTLGARAAREAGVVLERFAVVRRVPPARWAAVVAALLEGVSVVLAEVPRGVRMGDARRLEARARGREAVLVALVGFDDAWASWPAGVAYTVHVDGSTWEGLDHLGFLEGRRMRVRVEGRGAASQPRIGELARTG